ncbi:hypothetical protein SO802_029159 [Lithocarpus litseifolius]|uniref:CCHC-type domain-containing protein n=1 Tax=Lithocarpus litseifolius TaxID=425828 RepID=A0AAW2BXZ6_9ROSI
MKNFVGKPSNITSRIYNQLSNLRCRTLGDYKWCEDVFTTRVMHRSDCNSPFWKEKFINGLPKLFGEMVKETLSCPLSIIDYDNLTYEDTFSTIRSEGMKMCRDMKIQTPSKRKSKSNDDSEKFSRKRTASKYYKRQKYGHFKDNDFYKEGKKSRDCHKVNGKHKNSTQKASKKGVCYKCGKKGHYKYESRSKAKSLINTLISGQTSNDEVFKLLELDHIDNELANSSKPSRASSSSSSSPDVDMACKDSYCRNKTISVLSTQEELLIDLIEQIENPVIKARYLSKFHKSLIKETKEPRPTISEPKVNLKKIYNRFTKTKKEVTVNDLQQEIKETKSKVRTLKQELTIPRVDHSLLNQKVKRLESTSHQGNEEGPSFQNPSDEEDKTVNPTAHMVQEEQPS